jgi:hypothetical protein
LGGLLSSASPIPLTLTTPKPKRSGWVEVCYRTNRSEEM